MRILFMNVLLIGFAVIAIYAVNPKSGGDWEVPAKYETMKNPLADDKGSLAEGKSLYVLHCKSCHGKEGLGDGPKAAQLDTYSGDFTDEDFQAQSDGVLFYKTQAGMGDMPSFEKKLSDPDEIWSIVNYLRTLE